MRLKSTEIENEILAETNRDKAEYYNNYFVGLTNNPQTELFINHKVNKNNGFWHFNEAIDHNEAINAVKLLTRRGMRGEIKNSNQDSVFVYCYRISYITSQ